MHRRPGPWKPGESAAALLLAERAVTASPANFVTDSRLGRILLDLDQVPRPFAALKTAAGITQLKALGTTPTIP